MDSMTYARAITEVAGVSTNAYKQLFDISLDAARQLGALNGDFARSVFDGARAPKALDLREQMRAYSRSLDHGSTHFKNVNDILLKTQTQLAKVNAQHMGNILQTLASQLEEGTPAGGVEVSKLAELMKANFKSAESAYETIFKITNTLMDSGIKSIAPPQVQDRRQGHHSGNNRKSA